MKPALITITFLASIIANQSFANQDADLIRLLARIQAMSVLSTIYF